MKTDKDEMITREIISLFEETFEKVHGANLDRGTSLFETLDGLDAAAASREIPGIAETVAGHVNHAIFYIAVLEEYITDKRSGKTDWSESWQVKTVDDTQWKALKARLRQEYSGLLRFIGEIGEWDNGDYFGGTLSILAHCSYHLGAIRQLIPRA
jgi:hypothetical protein